MVPQEIQILPDKKTTVIFQFLYHPEYIGVGNNLIINMEHCKVFGKITQLIPERIDESLGTDKKDGKNTTVTKQAKSQGRSRAASIKSGKNEVVVLDSSQKPSSPNLENENSQSPAENINKFDIDESEQILPPSIGLLTPNSPSENPEGMSDIKRLEAKSLSKITEKNESTVSQT